jgi:hypothetical protein
MVSKLLLDDSGAPKHEPAMYNVLPAFDIKLHGPVALKKVEGLYISTPEDEVKFG